MDKITNFINRADPDHDFKRQITRSTTVYLRRNILKINFLYQKTRNSVNAVLSALIIN
jgi:hypothetical protein